MAALSTYTPLVSYSLASAATSITVTDIPTTYTDLRIVINALAYYASSGTYLTGALQVGSSNTIDTGSNYNSRYMYSDGSTVGSGVQAGTDIRYSLDVMAASTDTGARSTNIIDIMGYSKANNFKTMLIRTNTIQTATGTNMLRESVAQWRNSTAAINTIKFTNIDGTNIYAGSTITIYGIANNTAGAKATGGAITSDSAYFYHAFYATDTFTPTQSLSCDYLVVAGGGGGANSGAGGGGGAGGHLTSIGGSPLSVTAQAYTITVGAGGAGVTGNNYGGDGTNSIFSTVTATGGGGGGTSGTGTGNGRTGGSGGGGSYSGTGGAKTSSPVQGNDGGAGAAYASTYAVGGGGGGAGGVGVAGTTAGVGGAGGAGLANSITGTSVTRAGGGGGAADARAGVATQGAGGTGGGGNAAAGNGTSGTVSTGGGGGGAGYSAATLFTGGSGGSGVVIIRYAR